MSMEGPRFSYSPIVYSLNNLILDSTSPHGFQLNKPNKPDKLNELDALKKRWTKLV